MAKINIHREHELGLAKARKVARAWAEKVEDKYGLECTAIAGKTSDTIEFTRSGVAGRLIVAPDHFDLEAKLGFLVGAFSGTIEREIVRELDAALAQGGGAARKAAAKPGGRRGA
ncbi:MAG: polyhydroxyalkanoic acid system family protein [Rubrivivax sp.]